MAKSTVQCLLSPAVSMLLRSCRDFLNDPAEQKALFLAHAEEVAEEIRKLHIRQRYLSGKVAYWDAPLGGDLELAEQIAAQNQEIAKELK